MLNSVLSLILALAVSLPGEYRWFHHYSATTEDIRAVCQDDSGRVWMGTSRGLFRYGDYPDGVKYDGMPDVFRQGVDQMSAFIDGTLLVRCQDGHHIVYDHERNRAVELGEVLDSLRFPLHDGWSLKIIVDPNGGVWSYDSDRLFYKPADEDSATMVLQTDHEIRGMDCDGDMFCLVTDDKLYVSGLDRLDDVRSYSHGITFHRNSIWPVLDGDHNIWLGSQHLFRIDSKTMEMQCLMENLPVMDVIKIHTGDILVATGTYGVLHWSKDGRLVERIEHEPFKKGSLASNNVRSIRESSSGDLWVCYYKPIVSVCAPGGMPSPDNHITPLLQKGLEENVSCFAEAPDGTVWFGTDGQGIYTKSPDGVIKELDIELAQPAVTALMFDSKGRKWIGTYRGGVYCIDGSKVKHVLPSVSCCDIRELSNGDIWLCTQGDGIFKINQGSTGDVSSVDVSYNRWPFQTAEGDGVLYAATSSGLITLDLVSDSFSRMTATHSGEQSFANTHFRSAVMDSRGLLWLAGNQSECPLEIYDTKRDRIIHLPSLKGQIVKSIVEVADGSVWLVLEEDFVHVLVNYVPSTQDYEYRTSIFRLKSQESVRNYNNSRSVISLSDGSILFGSTAGYKQVLPSAFPSTFPGSPSSRLSVSAVKVNNEYLRVGKEYSGKVILPMDVMSLEGITLRHNENYVSLVISSDDYSSAYETLLYFRIRNKGDKWEEIRDNTIDLPSLRPGHYEIELASGYPDGSLASSAQAFYLNVKAPLYARWYAFLLYILLVVGIAGFVLSYFYERQKQKMSIARIQQEADRQYHLNEMKLRFFTNISHDFRTPLSLIITPLESYLSDPAHKDSEKALRPVYKNAVRLLNLINQILDFRKLEMNGIQLNPSYGNLVPFLRDICSSFALFADETGRNLEFESDDDVICTSFDKDKLTKIMMNLLSNAFKFTPKEGCVRVSVRQVGQDVQISVADSGPGIPDELKDKVFERFYQSHDEMSTYMGSGIGLHIVKEFVRLHDGSIKITDNTPSGAVFTLLLPVKEQQVEATAASDIADEIDELGQTAGAGAKILIVEDNDDFREFMKEQFSGEFDVFTAVDGRSALKVLDREAVDIIISDIMMEGMDGLQLCRKVKANLATSHIPVILLTAKALAEDELRGFELGADDYVTKPFHMSILRHRVRRLLDLKIQRQKDIRMYPDISPSQVTVTSLDEQFLSKAISIVEDNISDPDFSVEKFSDAMSMHRTHLYRKLMSLTGKTPLEFIRLIRLKRAAQYLEQSQMYVSEVAYQVGFNSPKVFSKHFIDEFGMTPTDYQQKKQ